MKKIINLTLKNNYFLAILEGKKKLEGRLYKGKYKEIRIGDILHITNVNNTKDNRTLELEVKKIYTFPSFEEAFKKLDHLSAVPETSLEECLLIYHTFYPKEITLEYGVVFFEIALVHVHDHRLHHLKT